MQGFSSAQPDIPTAFLGNLPKETVQGDFDELFKGLKLQEVRIIHDKETGEPKGYGYAMFHDAESLEKALAMDGTVLNGQRIKIDQKRPSNRNRGPQQQQPQRGGRSTDFGGGAFNTRRSDRFEQQQGGGQMGGERRYPDRANRPVPDAPPFTAYVGNLPEEAVESDLETMFQGLQLVKVHLVIDRDTQHHKGYGYAEFETKDALIQALTLDGAQWMNKTLKVNVHERKERFGDRGGFNSQGGGGGGGGGRFEQGGGRFEQGSGGAGAGGGRFDQGANQGGSGRFARGGDFQERRDRPQRRPVEEPAPIDDGKERPKLVLQKRTEGGAATEAAKPASTSSKPSPFGNAKPVDTATKLRQLEEEKKAADAKKAAEKKEGEDKAGEASGDAKTQ